jgi:ribosome-binding factor A
MPTRRQIQVADEIQHIVSYLLQRELKDPRIGFVTVTSVEVTSDLKYARIFVSVMGTPEEQKATLDALASSRGFVRRELASRMTMRTVPEVQFKHDRGMEYSDRINRLLNELKEEEARKAADNPSEPEFEGADLSGDKSTSADGTDTDAAARPREESV